MQRVLIGAVILLFLVCVLPITQAVTVVEAPQQQQKASSTPFSFLKSGVFWIVLVLIGFIFLVGVGLFFLIRAIIKYIKSRDDIFFKLRQSRIKLAKAHSRYVSNHWYKIEKNIPIRLVRYVNGVPDVSKPIAYHRGDYMSHEGNYVISLNVPDNNKFFFFPITDILIIPNKKKITYKVRDRDTKKEKEIVIDDLPTASDIVKFNENEILLYAEGISRVGLFMIVVLKTRDGKIIDLSFPAYHTLREVVIGDFLYDQSDEFVRLSKKAMDLNPTLRYETKTKDSSNSVDIPSETT